MTLLRHPAISYPVSAAATNHVYIRTTLLRLPLTSTLLLISTTWFPKSPQRFHLFRYLKFRQNTNARIPSTLWSASQLHPACPKFAHHYPRQLLVLHTWMQALEAIADAFLRIALQSLVKMMHRCERTTATSVPRNPHGTQRARCTAATLSALDRSSIASANGASTWTSTTGLTSAM